MEVRKEIEDEFRRGMADQNGVGVRAAEHVIGELEVLVDLLDGRPAVLRRKGEFSTTPVDRHVSGSC